MPLIRSAFQEELNGVSQTLVELSQTVAQLISDSTKALLAADLQLAEEVISSDDAVDDKQHELDARIIDIIARQQPIALKTGSVIESRNTDMAIEVEKDDDAMDQLHRDLISTLLSKDSAFSVETAIDLTLVGRYYERYADHAVSVARRVYFLVTGEYFD